MRVDSYKEFAGLPRIGLRGKQGRARTRNSAFRAPGCGLDDGLFLRQCSTMQTDAFESSLRAFVRRTPFQPFTVELTSGTRFQVLHPEALAFNAGLAVYISPDGTPSMFDHESVSQLVDSADAPSRSSQAA
jgi:hypothetical protein